MQINLCRLGIGGRIMKKLLIIPLLILLSLSNAFGMDLANILLAQVDTSRMLAMHPAFLEMVAGGGAAAETSCPPYYADANVTFSWNGDHDDGVFTGCDSAGNAVLGVDDGSTTHTDYGEGGSVGLLRAQTKDITWTNTGQAYINGDAPYTVWVRVKIDGPCDNQASFWEANEQTTPADNIANLAATTTAQRFLGIFEGNNDGGVTARGEGYVDATWDDVGYSWNNDAAPTDHSANTNASWQEDVGEITFPMTQDIYEFKIGSEYKDGGDCGDTEYIYVDRFVIMSGYETALPANW